MSHFRECRVCNAVPSAQCVIENPTCAMCTSLVNFEKGTQLTTISHIFFASLADATQNIVLDTPCCNHNNDTGAEDEKNSVTKRQNGNYFRWIAPSKKSVHNNLLFSAYSMPVPFGVKERKGKSEGEDGVCNAKRTRVKWNLKTVNRTQWTHPSTPVFNCITDNVLAKLPRETESYPMNILIRLFFHWFIFN